MKIRCQEEGISFLEIFTNIIYITVLYVGVN
jgi:hypothetical protein